MDFDTLPQSITSNKSLLTFRKPNIVIIIQM